MHVLQLTEQNAGTTAGFFLFVVSATEKQNKKYNTVFS